MVVNGVFLTIACLVLKAAAHSMLLSFAMGTLMAFGLAPVAYSMLVLKDMSQIPELSLSSWGSTFETL